MQKIINFEQSNLLFKTVQSFKKMMKIVKPSESIDFKGLNGGSGWTRTTDLTLIRGAL